jgi:BirA family biotin operon repressor/biotin-[acetyl-CoA-carboxylase] ligase
VNDGLLDWRRIAVEAGVEVVWHAETGSTNDDARQLALEGAAHGTVVIADSQRQGRGRRGAAWISPPGKNLLCSMVLRPALSVEKWARLTHACALAVCEALEAVRDLPPPAIKWPNDVYLRDRKVCGLLVESNLDARGGFAVAGAGVNLNLTGADFPEEIRETATSVWLERGGQCVSREDFAIRFIRGLRAQCVRAAENFPALLSEYDARSFLRGRHVTMVSGGVTLEGIVEGTGPEGELRLRREGGRVELVSSADFVRIAG